MRELPFECPSCKQVIGKEYYTTCASVINCYRCEADIRELYWKWLLYTYGYDKNPIPIMARVKSRLKALWHVIKR